MYRVRIQFCLKTRSNSKLIKANREREQIFPEFFFPGKQTKKRERERKIQFLAFLESMGVAKVEEKFIYLLLLFFNVSLKNDIVAGVIVVVGLWWWQKREKR